MWGFGLPGTNTLRRPELQRRLVFYTFTFYLPQAGDFFKKSKYLYMTAIEQLKEIFGVIFEKQEDILAVRQYHSPNTFCVNDDNDIIAIHSSENDYTQIRIPSSLSKLQYLNLSDNKNLKSLEFETALPALWHFDVSDSALEELKLPAGFENLKWLDASRNQLKTFVPQGQFKKLTYLDLSSNQLNDFPTAILDKLAALEGLYLKGNDNFPSTKNLSINKQGNCLPFMQRFARELKKGQTVNNEFKVLLVGNGGVGKTCLVERLVYDSFEKEHLSTHGVALEQYLNEENPKEFPYILNLWDFGGQDIYHATHRLFMQSNAIYLALWDEKTLKNDTSEIEEEGEIRKYENFSLQYWLHYIKHQGGNSPIIVVKTKTKEDSSFHPQQQEIQTRYGVSDFLQIDSKVDDWTDNGFDRLLLFIKESIKKLRQEQELPKNWAELRQHLRLLQKAGNQVLSIDEYLDIASDYDIECPMEVLTDWLVTSGVVFYRVGYFDSTIILDQQWAIKAIYTVFKRTDNSPYYRIKDTQSGKFTGKDLQSFWKSAEYNFSSAEQELLVNFMLGCEICFEVENEDENKEISFEERKFFAPQMMSEGQPESVDMFLNITDKNELLYIRYAHNFLHYGIIQSFIVRTQNLADVRGIWKYGIVLKEDNNYAIVKEVNKRIEIITTKDNIELLDKIRNTLEDLQQEKVEESVSLNGIDYVAMEELISCKADHIKANNTGVWISTQDFHVFTERKKQEKFQLKKDIQREEALVEKIDKEKVIKEQVLPNEGKIEFKPTPAIILFLQANPTTEPISWQEEFLFIVEKIAKAKKDGILDLAQEKSVSLDDMIDAIEDHEPQIIHFTGHGREEKKDRFGNIDTLGGLAFHNEAKNGAELIGADKLEPQFKAIKTDFPNISIVLLSACYSQQQAKAISKAGIFTIGTSDKVIAKAAKLFAAGFYKRLSKTKDIAVAIQGGITRSINEDTKIEELIHLFYNGAEIKLNLKNE